MHPLRWLQVVPLYKACGIFGPTACQNSSSASSESRVAVPFSLRSQRAHPSRVLCDVNVKELEATDSLHSSHIDVDSLIQPLPSLPVVHNQVFGLVG